MSEKADKIIKDIDATMSLEGMPLNNENKDFIRRIVDEEITIDEAIAILNKRYNRP